MAEIKTHQNQHNRQKWICFHHTYVMPDENKHFKMSTGQKSFLDQDANLSLNIG